MAEVHARHERDPKLSPEQKQRIDAWLKEKWKMPALCPVSGRVQWRIADHLVVANLFQPGIISMGGPSYPQVMLICSDCGYTMYFNAVMITGLLPPDPGAPKLAEVADESEKANG